MSNGLGINFFRYSTEEDTTSWCQIFAKLSFDDVELSQKGALFGVVRGSKDGEWSELDMEVTAWVDEYFNGVEKSGGLSDFLIEFNKKFPDVESSWVWIYKELEKRKIKVSAKSTEVYCKVVVGEKTIDLSDNLVNQRVVVGDVLSGNKLIFGIGNIENIDDIENSLDKSKACAFLKIVVDDLNNESQDVVIKEVPLESLTRIKEQVPELAKNDYVVKPTFLQRLSLGLKRKHLVEISSDESKKKRMRLATVAGFVFVALLLFSLLAGGAKKRKEEEASLWLKYSEPIEKIVTEAVGISKINQQGAKKMLEEAKVKYESGKGGFDEVMLVELSKKIDDAWTVVSGEVNSQLTLSLNLELIRAGFNAAKMSSYSDGLTIISMDNGVVMTADLESKAMKVVAGKGAGLGWIDSVSSNKATYVLTKGGVFVAGNETNSLIFDSAVTDPVGISIFGSNIYVLEKGNKEIYKYTITDSGFGERQRWLKEGQSIKSSPIDIDIDVDIWVLTESNEVERFRRGIKETFSLTGIEPGTSLVKLAVDPNSEKIALLSILSGSVHICSKETGVCDKQLKNEKISQAKDVVYDQKGNLLILFAGEVSVLN